MFKAKLVYKFKGLWYNKFKILKDIMTFIGALVTLNNFVKLSGSEFWIELFRKMNSFFLEFVLVTALFIIWKRLPRNEYKYKVKGVNGDAFVSLCLGDVLSDEGSIVIPTDSCFDTSMYANMISAECIQGQFQNKYFKNNLQSLDTLIEESLKSQNDFVEIERVHPMKNKRYSLGTIARINIPQAENGKRAYLLSVVDMSEYFTPENRTPDGYKEMLINFWQQLSVYGHNEERLAVSVLGVGRAGYSIDIDKAIVYIVNSYIDAVKTNNIVKNLAIYIHWNAITKKRVDFFMVKKHIKAICKYSDLRK